MASIYRKVLVVGGTGPSGPYVLNGLLERGCEVTILHRGLHEPDCLPDVRHIHADPHFFESISSALQNERFNAVVVMYGRLAPLAEVFAGRCERLIAVSGMPAYGGYFEPESIFPGGMKVLQGEHERPANPRLLTNEKARSFVEKLLAAEEAVWHRHAEGAYQATILRYPAIYGPRAVVRLEWSVVKRILDCRSFMLLPQGGLGIRTRCAAANAAQHVLLSLDSDASIGETVGCSDEDTYSIVQWVHMIADAMGAKLDIVDVPNGLGWVTEHLTRSRSSHALLDHTKARRLLGYRDLIPANQALEETVNWLRANPADAHSELFSDRFSYGVEDQVRQELQCLSERCSPLQWEHKVAAHMYAHPKAPSLAADHMGR